jgi:hypothetical protein
MDDTMADENTLAATPGDEQIVNLDQTVAPPDEHGADVEASTEEEAEKPEGAGDDAGEQGQSEGDKPKKLSGSRRERLRNEQLRRENEELRTRMDALERRSQAGASDEKEPQETDFNGDIFKFEREWNAWNARKIVREERERDHQARSQTAQADQWRERVLEHQDRVEEAREEIADYDKVLASSKMPVADEVGREILSSDKSALISYYLAKNPEKLEALNKMTGRELAREIGRLEGAVRMPPKNGKTSAPAPIAALKGGAAPSFDPTKASMDDYIAKRQSGWSG